MKFKVQPTIELILSTIAWLIGWRVMFGFLTQENYFSGTLGSSIVDYIYKSCFVTICTLVGPCSFWLFSWKMQIEMDSIIVYKCFGIFRNEYSIADVENVYHEVGKGKQIKIVFNDGRCVKASSMSTGYSNLSAYLSAKVLNG